MKISQDGRVTIPQRLRKQFGFHAGTEVEFVELGGQLFVAHKRMEQSGHMRAMKNKRQIDMTTNKLMMLLRDPE